MAVAELDQPSQYYAPPAANHITGPRNDKISRKACQIVADVGENFMSTISLPAPVKTPPKAGPPSTNPLAAAVAVIIAAIAAVIILRIPALTSPWSQGYDPTGHWWLSTLIAALPVVVLLGSLALGHVKAHYAALLGLATALLVAIFGFHMPGRLAATTAVYGAGYGLFPIGWIVLNVIFMYQLTVESGCFNVLQHSMTGITQDRRLQLLLIAFCFGAFFEGAAGFGTPVAVTAAILIGLGFKPLQASGLSLIANTAPVAFGALGIPIVALSKVTGFSEVTLGAMAGRILTPFCVLVPFWLICAFVGWSAMLEVWPAILVAGVSYAIPQLLVSNLHGPWLANIISSVISMICLVGFLFVWHPKRVWTFEGEEAKTEHRAAHGFSRSEVSRAWVPWVILSVIVFMWGTQTVKKMMNTPEKTFTSMATGTPRPARSPIRSSRSPVLITWWSPFHPGRGQGRERACGIRSELGKRHRHRHAAGGRAGGAVHGAYTPKNLVSIFLGTLMNVRFSLLTIGAMLALGYSTRYAGLDATHGAGLRLHRGTVTRSSLRCWAGWV